MEIRRLRTGLAVVSLALVAALAGCSSQEAAAPRPSPRQSPRSTTTVIASTTTSTPPTTVVGGEGISDATASAVAQWRLLVRSDAPQREVWALMSDPANSDLDPAQARTAAATARAVVLADATGVGRDAFPGYWPAPGTARAEACCPAARVLAAGAGRGLAEGVAEALVVWERTPGAEPEVASVLLRATPGAWAPVHPWQV